MSKNFDMLIAGFGGQGILFAGKIAAYAGLFEGYQVSWLPSYGPEMRGGTASCSVSLSSETIGSPQVLNPNILVAMNLPSFDKFIGSVQPGSLVVVDSSLVQKQSDRTDIKAFYIPATALAEEHNLKGLANIILVGKVLAETGFATLESVEKAIEKSVPARKSDMKLNNIAAIKLGMSL